MSVKALDLNLQKEMKNADIRSKRRVLSRIMSGNWTTTMKGQGMEFAGFRQYVYGDDASKIDWNATLRAKETLVRQFEEYRNVNVFLILDMSNSMLLGSHDKMKAEYAAQLMFNLALTVVEGGDSMGYALITDELLSYNIPSIGKQNMMRLMGDLSNPKNYGGKLDFKKCMNQINGLLPERTLIILVSDFLGLEDGWERYIKILGMSSQVMGIMVRDDSDYMLPEEAMQFLVEDPYKNEKLYIDSAQYSLSYKQAVIDEEEYIKSVFEKSKADFIMLRIGGDLLKKLSEHFNKRMNLGTA